MAEDTRSTWESAHRDSVLPSHLGCSSLNPATDSSTRTPSSPCSGSHGSLDLHADACMAQYLLMSLRLNCSRKVKEKEENAQRCNIHMIVIPDKEKEAEETLEDQMK